MTLRIQRTALQDLVVFVLAGRIQADQVPELQALFQSEAPEQEIVLDLKEVRLVDRDVVRFLAHLEAQGMKLEKLLRLYARVDSARKNCIAGHGALEAGGSSNRERLCGSFD